MTDWGTCSISTGTPNWPLTTTASGVTSFLNNETITDTERLFPDLLQMQSELMGSKQEMLFSEVNIDTLSFLVPESRAKCGVTSSRTH